MKKKKTEMNEEEGGMSMAIFSYTIRDTCAAACCCCSFCTTWKHQFVSKMYRYSTVFLKSWISLNFDTKWCFHVVHSKAAACSSTCVAYIKWDNNENIGRCSMLCGWWHPLLLLTFLEVILHGRGSRHFGYKLWLFIIEMKDNWVCKTWLKDQKSYI